MVGPPGRALIIVPAGGHRLESKASAVVLYPQG
jgi:hypothetical protein